MLYSIIIPHKNIPQLLQRCLDSIPRREDIQIIVIDDNSSPEIVDFAHFPGRERDDVEIVFTREGRGAGYARNEGLKRAKGKWLLFADTDDFFLPDFLKTLDVYGDTDYDLVTFRAESADCDTLKPVPSRQGYYGVYEKITEDVDVDFTKPKYFFDSTIYENRVYNGVGKADPSVEIQFGPNIKDWPSMVPLTDNILLKVVSEIHDPVTTTDELIPSGETSSFRSNPLGLAEFTLSRKDPEYVGRAKKVRAAEEAREDGKCPCQADDEVAAAFNEIHKLFPDVKASETEIGSVIYAVKPGDGSAREQAASCQKVLGGWANIANEYATKRYRSNLINWGMLPFLIEEGDLPFANGDYLFIPEIRKAVEEKASDITAYVVKGDHLEEFHLKMGELTDDEREIILKGCLINYNRVN